MRRPVTILASLVLVLNACGGDDGDAVTTVTTPPWDTTTEPTTTTASPPTTLGVGDGSLGSLVGAPVADPFHGSGFHEMQWAEEQQFLVATTGLPGGGRLAVGDFGLPVPVGLTLAERLLIVWAEESPEAVPPFAVALYRLGTAGWEPLRVFPNASILAFLGTTTDYQAKAPAGTAVLHASPTSFTWDGSLARMIAGVTVYDDLAATHVVFQGEVDCGADATGGGCILISDDGVLRPGDVEDAVLALEQHLQAVGYFPMAPDTVYDSQTEQWVKTLQRDYRLTVDGKVGPQTHALVESLFAGTSGTALAFSGGVSGIPFGASVTIALPQLTQLLGLADYSVGWEIGACGPNPPHGGWQWYKVTWGGFTAWFTERSGSRQFDGWQVTDLDAIPANLYFAGGFGPSTNWSQVTALGGVYDPFYGWWYLSSLGYGMGVFETAPGNPPAGNLQIEGFATGTAAILYDC